MDALQRRTRHCRGERRVIVAAINALWSMNGAGANDTSRHVVGDGTIGERQVVMNRRLTTQVTVLSKYGPGDHEAETGGPSSQSAVAISTVAGSS